MAEKSERSSFNTSKNLKNALIAKGANPALEVPHSVYAGAANDIHLLVHQYNNGRFRTLNITAGVASVDNVNGNDPALVRFWMDFELDDFIGQWPGVEGAVCTLNASTWTCVITHLGINYTGTDTSEPDAMCKAFIKVLQLP